MTDIIKIGLPNLSKPQGPKIFLSRLRECLQKENLAKTTNFLWPFYDIGLFNSIARSYYGKPYILRLDGIAFDLMESKGRNRDINIPIFKSIKNANGIIYQSMFNKKTVETFSGRNKKPSCIIYNGVDLNHFSVNGPTCREHLNIPNDDIVLLTSSSWRSHKRLEDVIQIFLLLYERYKDIHLLILGDVKDNIAPHKNLHLSGFISPDRLPDWYRSADIFIFLSWLDSCPNTVVEAIASGLPVVCTNQGGTKELVEITNSGIVAMADKNYQFNLVDLYNPPRPDYKSIIDALIKIRFNIKEYQNSIDRRKIDISFVANEYVSFCKSCLKVHPGI